MQTTLKNRLVSQAIRISKGKGATTALVAGWLCLVGFGFVIVEKHANTPGEAAKAPAVVRQTTAQPELLVFLHPGCPCSRASVRELERVISRCDHKVGVKVYMFDPNPKPGNWQDLGLGESAATLANVQVLKDENGRIAQNYGVRTSGQVMLYSPKGGLVFSGGLTSARGHEGDTAGQDAIVDYVINRKLPEVRTAPVFGCSFGFDGGWRGRP